MTPSVEQMKQGTCGCGRLATGNCCGLHGVTDAQYEYFKSLYESGEINLNNVSGLLVQLNRKLGIE